MQTTALSGNESHCVPAPVHEVLENTGFAEIAAVLEETPVAAEGLEPPTRGI